VVSLAAVVAGLALRVRATPPTTTPIGTDRPLVAVTGRDPDAR
jgi:hypothetical protein